MIFDQMKKTEIIKFKQTPVQNEEFQNYSYIAFRFDNNLYKYIIKTDKNNNPINILSKEDDFFFDNDFKKIMFLDEKDKIKYLERFYKFSELEFKNEFDLKNYFLNGTRTKQVLDENKKKKCTFVKKEETGIKADIQIIDKSGNVKPPEILNRIKKDLDIKEFGELGLRTRNVLTSKNTTFKIDFVGVCAHQSYGPRTKILTKKTNGFCIRASRIKYERKANQQKIPFKDFEWNDSGIILAAHYLDKYTRDHNFDFQLNFDDYNFDFIEKYGSKKWIEKTGYLSYFDYEGYQNQILKQYSYLPENFTLPNVFPKTLIKDLKYVSNETE